MSFTPNIPASGQTLGSSRTQVLGNFSSLRTTISNATQPNHIDVNNAGAGKHIFVQMPAQTPGAANLTLANEGALITQTSGGRTDLYYNRDGENNAGTPVYYKMTGAMSAASSGYTVLFGGIIIQWGSATVTAGGTSNNFPIAFPNNLFSVTFTPIAANPYAFSVSASNLTSFTAKGGNSSAFFIAIGN